jgi:serine phosphatase RsbU (regulator of sigma subunit)
MDSPDQAKLIFESYEHLSDYKALPYVALYTSKKGTPEIIYEKKSDDFEAPLLDVLFLFKDSEDNAPQKGTAKELKEALEAYKESKKVEQDPPKEKDESSAPEKKADTGDEKKEEPAGESKEAESPKPDTEEKPAGEKNSEGADKSGDIHYFVVRLESRKDYYIVAQSMAEIAENGTSLANFIAKNIASVWDTCFTASNAKYKEELGKLREFQARLFPKFDNIDGMDISSVYLPADLMSGNFIDAFYISENVYQIMVCTVDGYDASSNFTAASIRTIARTAATTKIVPSALITLALKRLDKILQGLHSLIHITVIQINTQSGDCKLSSLGAPNLIYAAPAKKKVESVNASPTGKILSKRKDVMDISMHLDKDDVMLFYSNGITKAYSETHKEQYGINRLAKAMYDSIKEESIFITHNVTSSIYDFTEYATFEEDIILLCIKRV